MKPSPRPATGLVAAVLLAASAGCAEATPEPAWNAPAAPPPSSAAAPPSPSRTTAAPLDAKLTRLVAGQRKVLVHVTQPDQDLSATYEGPIDLGDGTDDGALFRFLPARNGRVMLEALRPREEGGRWCVAVVTASLPPSLETMECEQIREMLFTVEGVPGRKGALSLTSPAFGPVRWDQAGRRLYVKKAGDASTVASFTLVDRGKA